MDKILFLDIDGVVNPTDYDYSLTLLWKIDKLKYKSRDEFGEFYDPRCINWLAYIIEKTKCKIVISSSRRSRGIENLRLMWEMRDYPGEIIDVTPEQASEETINLYAATNNPADRGYEIQEWIDTHQPDIYCIVDDNNDMLSFQNFVKTDSKIGLDYKTAHDIIAILNTI